MQTFRSPSSIIWTVYPRATAFPSRLLRINSKLILAASDQWRIPSMENVSAKTRGALWSTWSCLMGAMIPFS